MALCMYAAKFFLKDRLKNVAIKVLFKEIMSST